jgi:hypothetical protein
VGPRSITDTNWITLDGRGRWPAGATLQPVRRIGQGADATAFGRISRLAAHPDGGVVVMDAEPADAPIVLLDSLGRVRASFGSFGEGPGQFGRGSSIAVTPDHLVVIYDSQRARLTVFDSRGNLVRTVSTLPLGGIGNLGSVRPGPRGTVFIAQYVKSSDPRPSASLWLDQPRRIHAVNLLTGASTLVPHQEPLPPHLERSVFAPLAFRDVTVEGEVVGAIGTRLAFHRTATTGAAVRGYLVAAEAPRVLPEERQEMERFVEFQQASMLEIFRPPRREVPTIKPLVTGLSTDHRGRIWLERGTTGVVGPPRMLAKTPAGEVTGRYHDRPSFAAFLASGTYLGTVDFPNEVERLVFSGDYAWGVERDVDGLEYLVQFRLPK